MSVDYGQSSYLVLEGESMYYSQKCSYCSKVFYVYDSNRTNAAQKLYEGIKAHLIEYGEDHKEFQYDESPGIEADQMYDQMQESEDRPSGGYEV